MYLTHLHNRVHGMGIGLCRNVVTSLWPPLSSAPSLCYGCIKSHRSLCLFDQGQCRATHADRTGHSRQEDVCDSGAFTWNPAMWHLLAGSCGGVGMFTCALEPNRCETIRKWHCLSLINCFAQANTAAYFHSCSTSLDHRCFLFLCLLLLETRQGTTLNNVLTKSNWQILHNIPLS